MKSYAIRISRENDEETIESGWTFKTLKEAAQVCDEQLNIWMKDPKQESIFTIVRETEPKGKSKRELNTELVRVITSIDHGQPSYEGMILLNQSDDFERLALMGKDGACTLGNCSIRIETRNQSMCCFYPSLTELLSAIKEMHDQRNLLTGRTLVINHAKTDHGPVAIAELYYSLNPDGSLRLESYLDPKAEKEDAQKLLDFIHQEQKLGRISDHSLSTEPLKNH